MLLPIHETLIHPWARAMCQETLMGRRRPQNSSLSQKILHLTRADRLQSQCLGPEQWL
ncbi:hypothetical protein BCR44DRAFT_1428149, partial [Catenaria anguillulae PL171]